MKLRTEESKKKKRQNNNAPRAQHADMADIDDLLSGLLSAIVLVFQVALGTVLASLQYAFRGVRWWGGEVACSLCLVVFFLFVRFHVFFLVFFPS